MDKIFTLLGPSVFDSFSLIMTFLETQLCIALFARHLGRRRHFFLRIGLMWVLGIVMSYGLGVIYFNYPAIWIRVLCYLAVTAYCLVFTYGCFQDNLEGVLLVVCAGTATYQVVNKLYPLIQNLLGINDKLTISLIHPDYTTLQEWEWVLFYVFRIAAFLLLAYFFRPKGKVVRNKRTERNVALLSVFMVITVNVLICLGRVYESESMAVSMLIKAFSIDINAMILFLCGFVFHQNERDHQMEVLQQLWKQDQAQFQSVKASMDAINMKCHDLKHIFRRIEGKLNQEELEQLQEAITFYDANIKTGNEVLDVVLCEKSLLCQKNGIQFTCMGSGAPFSFLTPVQTYTIFGNLIDNAVEAVQKLPDQEKKVITLTLQSTGGGLEIETSNYFDGVLHTDRDALDTTKPDQARHGFGIKSIQYIAAQYGGTVETAVQEDMFFLSIHFPAQKPA